MNRILIYILLLSSWLGAQQLEELQKRFNALNKFSVKFTQIVDGKKGLSGTFYHKKEKNLRLEMRNVVVVSDGESVWSYNKSLKKITVTYLEGTPLETFDLSSFVNEFPKNADAEELTLNGKKGIRLKAKKKSDSLSEALIILNEDGLISEMTVTNRDKSVMKVSFSSYNLNSSSISDALFTMERPEGVETVDLR
ncbi:MAG: outer membrane lipoprotein carrier protein LolA [Ignavibacteriales bacterium]|nr:Outer-membrane lipoprotein carrier protein [Ignavibacteriaceae bacterium]QOJ30266.1 MAG: outer membrane lipoprotein carrier protein LolA [Ignavibacteriales bacterium]